MLSICRVENTYLMIRRNHSNKRFTFIFYRLKTLKKKKKSQTCIPEFAKVTRANNKATATVTSAVNVELDSFS